MSVATEPLRLFGADFDEPQIGGTTAEDKDYEGTEEGEERSERRRRSCM